MRPIATDVARSMVCLYVCVCVFVKRMCPTKVAEPIEMPCGPNEPCTVKRFNLAALKVDDFACKIILAPFILANSIRTIPAHVSNAD